MEDQNAQIEAPWSVKKASKPGGSRSALKKDKSKELLEKAVKCLSAQKQNSVHYRNKLQHLDSVLDAVLSASAVAEVDSPVKPNEVTNVQAKPVDTTPTPPGPPTQVPTVVPLPANLSSDVLVSIEKLLKLGFAAGPQRRFMSKPFDAELFNLAGLLTSSKVNQSTRCAVFSHVESTLQWKRKALTRRLKKMKEADEDQKMNPMLDALSDAISRAMPPLLEAYLRDKALHVERVKAWQAESESEAADATANNATDATAAKRLPKPGPPKKIFRWNSECRELYYGVITRRLEGYHALNLKGPREEYLRSLFPTLMQLWPDGWITNASLWRAALPVFQQFSASHPPTNQAPTVNSKSAVLTASNAPSTTNSVGFTRPVSTASGSEMVTNFAVPRHSGSNTKSQPQLSKQSPVTSTTLPSVSVILNNAQAFVNSVPQSALTSNQQVSRFAAATAANELIVKSSNLDHKIDSPVCSKSTVSSSVHQSTQQQLVRAAGRPQTNMVGLGDANFTQIATPQNVRISSPPIIQSSVHPKGQHVSDASSAPVAYTDSIMCPRLSLVLTGSVSAGLSTSNAQHNVSTGKSLVSSVPPANHVSVASTQHMTSGRGTVATHTGSHPSTSSVLPNSTHAGSSFSQLTKSSDVLYPKVIPPRRQTAPSLSHRLPTASNVPSVVYATASAAESRVRPVVPISQFDRQNRQQHPPYQSAAVAFSATQIDSLQQRVVSATDPTSISSSASLISPSTMVLQRHPPPAHQQVSLNSNFQPQRIHENMNNIISAAHSVAQIKPHNQAVAHHLSSGQASGMNSQS
ncbi:unnamed protein product [Calicophoron daubneyi]